MRIRWGAIVSLAILAFSGCGGAAPEPVVDASGTVTLEGKPIEGAKVVFLPVDEKKSRFSHGTTDANGKFKLSTFGLNDGGLVGKHVVTVTKAEMPEEMKTIDVEKMKTGGITQGMAGYDKMMGLGGAKKVAPKNEIPAKYGDRNTTPINVEISQGGSNSFDLKLE